LKARVAPAGDRHEILRPGLTWMLAALLCLPAVARAAPSDDIRDTTDRIIKVLTDPELKPSEKTKERRAEIRKVVGQRFNFAEMARRSLATHWLERTPEQRDEFVRIFTDLVEYSYVEKIEQFGGEKIQYAGESIDADQATVRTKLFTRKDVPISIDYRLLNMGGRWQVYDVLIDGVSLVNEYRTQFNKIVLTKSYEELVRTMKVKRLSQGLEAQGVSSK